MQEATARPSDQSSNKLAARGSWSAKEQRSCTRLMRTAIKSDKLGLVKLEPSNMKSSTRLFLLYTREGKLSMCKIPWSRSRSSLNSGGGMRELAACAGLTSEDRRKGSAFVPGWNTDSSWARCRRRSMADVSVGARNPGRRCVAMGVEGRISSMAVVDGRRG